MYELNINKIKVALLFIQIIYQLFIQKSLYLVFEIAITILIIY